jgi:hypothetical protein
VLHVCIRRMLQLLIIARTINRFLFGEPLATKPNLTRVNTIDQWDPSSNMKCFTWIWDETRLLFDTVTAVCPTAVRLSMGVYSNPLIHPPVIPAGIIARHTVPRNHFSVHRLVSSAPQLRWIFCKCLATPNETRQRTLIRHSQPISA